MKINMDPRKGADMIADFGKTAAEKAQEGHVSMEAQVTKEIRSKLIYIVEF